MNAALTDARAYPATFSAALLEPSAAVPADVCGRDGAAASRRYDVYRNNVTVSLIEAIRSIYPAVEHITGEEFFRAMARFHVRATPPTSTLLFEYGRDFPAFIETYEWAREIPWLADVARIERAWLDAYHAADMTPLQLEDLAELDQSLLANAVFTPHPAAHLVRSPYPTVSIFTMAKQPSDADSLVESDEAEDALVTRPELDVMVRRLPAGGAAFLTALMQGLPLGQAVANAFEDAAAFDLRINLSGMVAAGVFTDVQIQD